MSSWVRCRCGLVVGIGSFPNPNVYRVISEEQYDEVADPVDRRKIGSLIVSGGVLVRCSNCHRVLIQWAGASGFECFAREPECE